MDRVPVLADDRRTTSWYMKFWDAVEAKRQKRIDEIFVNGEFLGVILLSVARTEEEPSDYRPSLDGSNCSITENECQAIAGAHESDSFIRTARQKFRAWPSTHDSKAPTICAGQVFGAKVMPSIPETVVSYA